VPLEINNAELDTGFTPTLAVQADAVMASYEPGFLRRQFNGVAHGFAVCSASFFIRTISHSDFFY
jgi:hypothetical protein